MKLYNSLSQSVETFNPNGSTVTVYVCGITPYDTTHLGHAFTYTSVDILIRYLEAQGHKVKYVQNVTDIDDDILRKAKEVNQDWQKLGNRWTAHFIDDMQTLNVRPPDHFPRATHFISEMITVVQQLLTADVAYKSGGNVYFKINAWPDYGKLSRLSQSNMLPVANQHGNNPNDPNKHHPLDFVLWQAYAPGEPAWNSPWGPGRPGWHIECSTMASHLLAETIDIHCGGADLIFPHHESEIAQIEPTTRKKPFARYWVHTAMVHNGTKKMSKSLGNLVMVSDLLQGWSPDTLRLYLGMHHYRKAWSHNPDRLAQAAELARKLRAAITVSGGSGAILDPASAQALFKQAMNNDLDTPKSIVIMNNLANEIITAAQSGWQIDMARQILQTMGQTFGLRLNWGQEDRVLTGWNKHLEQFKVLANGLTQIPVYDEQRT